MTSVNTEMHHPNGSTFLYPKPHVQLGVIIMLLVFITIAHNGIHLPSLPLLMILAQKLYFVPVILGGFWGGVRGGLLTAFVASLLYSHHGHMQMLDAPMFSAGQATDIVLLYLVGGMMGWLRNALRGELARHQMTSDERDHALKESERHLELARRSKHLAALGEMAAGIAHEIRNPLTSMQGAVDVLRRSVSTQPERAEPLLKRLDGEIARLDNLTSHFLEFARPPGVEMRRIQPCLILEESLSAVQAQREKKGIVFEIDRVEATCALLGDHDQLRQLLVNLFLNAIQFSPPDATVFVRESCEQDYWRISVRNTGPTIETEDISRVFDPFYTTRPDGTGLGLAIAFRIAEAHGGELDCESHGGETAFTLSLPVREA